MQGRCHCAFALDVEVPFMKGLLAVNCGKDLNYSQIV